MDLPPTARMAHDFAAAMSLALIVVDSHGDIRFANDAFCSMFGYEPDQILIASQKLALESVART